MKMNATIGLGVIIACAAALCLAEGDKTATRKTPVVTSHTIAAHIIVTTEVQSAEVEATDAQPAQAQTPGNRGRQAWREGGRRPDPAQFFARMDRDGDGKITKEEFRGPEQLFTRLDKNGDGAITKDELPQGPPQGAEQHRPVMQGAHRGAGEYQRGGERRSLESRFQMMDKNGDGKITQDEFTAPAEVFKRLDKNGDGVITKEELEQAAPRGGRGARGGRGGRWSPRTPATPPANEPPVQTHTPTADTPEDAPEAD